MDKSRRDIIILTIIMGIIWVSLLYSQLSMTNRAYSSYRKVFQINLDAATFRSFRTLDLMSFKTFFHGERCKDWVRRINEQDMPDTLALPIDSSFLFLQNLEGINLKMDFLRRFVAETHSRFDYRFLGYDVADSVLSVNLRNNNITDSYSLGLFSGETHDFYYKSDDVDANTLLSLGFKYPVLCINADGKILTDYLYLYFPVLESSFKKDIVGFYIIIILLLLLLLYCFIMFMIIVSRQRKINEFRTQMLHSITHELKTPITTISLVSQLMQDKSVLKDERASDEYLNMISEEANAMLGMVDEVLMVFRSQTMPKKNFEDVGIHELLKNVVAIHQLRLDQCNATVHFDFLAEHDVVFGDRAHLSNGFSNLIDNAIKYRNGDLVINISTRIVGDNIEIRVSDNGIGIAKENLQLIFEPFSRVNVDNEHYVKGYGLGLYYLSQIVKFHKGSIKVESELSKGATFVVSLPIKSN